jgi:predicted Zn-dependent protease
VPSSGSGLTSVFDNGAPLGRVDWVRDGVLTDLVRTRAGMQRARLSGHLRFPVWNLHIDAGGDAGLDEMVASTKRGLLLTCLWYIREVDPQTLLLTGLTRDGVYLIEDGRVSAAVNNFRFNESPVDLLRRATEAGAAEHVLCREWNDWFTRSVAPPLRIPDFTMSTVSQAY